MPKIPLADVLMNITDDLLRAEEHAWKRGRYAMTFEECELEFAVKAEKGGKGGVKVWVLDLGGSVKKSESNTIKLRFKGRPDRPVQAVAETGPEGPKLEKKPRRKTTTKKAGSKKKAGPGGRG